MATNAIGIPKYGPKLYGKSQVSYRELRDSLKQQLSSMPEFVKALKAADNRGWQRLLDDLAKHMQTDKKLAAFVRPRQKNGREGLSIGEPNWWVAAAAAAFAAGYAVGTACYRLGPCKFV